MLGVPLLMLLLGHAESQKAVKVKCAKLGKDPTVETSFLPDRSVKLPSLVLCIPLS